MENCGFAGEKSKEQGLSSLRSQFPIFNVQFSIVVLQERKAWSRFKLNIDFEGNDLKPFSNATSITAKRNDKTTKIFKTNRHNNFCQNAL